ncbi:unnamed protein product [Citrullus colocynthis]|uniref:Complex 1 LYR protein domain-containing protein n=1 Tax=Citrullus colocynthis TaxID=252529 RepID=A0ABP0YDF8_9ROSI
MQEVISFWLAGRLSLIFFITSNQIRELGCLIFFVISLIFLCQARHKPPRGTAGGVGVKRAEMPSLQTALPPELANNVIRVGSLLSFFAIQFPPQNLLALHVLSLQLYRECLRRAKYIGHQQHNTELLVTMVRQQFRKNMRETDPEKIQKLKDDAARGLINHILYESERMSGRKFSQSS